MTEQQKKDLEKYIVIQMTSEGVNMTELSSVFNWFIDNISNIPTPSAVTTFLNNKETTEKAERIIALETELAKLKV